MFGSKKKTSDESIKPESNVCAATVNKEENTVPPAVESPVGEPAVSAQNPGPIPNAEPANTPAEPPVPPARKAPKLKVCVHRNSFSVHAAMVILLFALAFSLLGLKGHAGDISHLYTMTALPVLSAILFLLLLPLLGERALWSTILPMLLCVAFFGFRVWSGDFLLAERIIFSLAYALLAVLYCLTVFGKVRLKLPLIAVLALPLCYQIFIKDILVGDAVGFAKLTASGELVFCAGMLELAVLCFMMAMLFLVTAMHQDAREPRCEGQHELTPMRGPVVRENHTPPM